MPLPAGNEAAPQGGRHKKGTVQQAAPVKADGGPRRASLKEDGDLKVSLKEDGGPVGASLKEDGATSCSLQEDGAASCSLEEAGQAGVSRLLSAEEGAG